jgi:hypothetical protein
MSGLEVELQALCATDPGKSLLASVDVRRQALLPAGG